jgi:hypothetical protein
VLSVFEEQALYTVAKVARGLTHCQSLEFAKEHGKRTFLEDVLKVTIDMASGKEGLAIQFICTTCPDYPFDYEHGQYVYSKGLGTQCGASARFFVEDLRPLTKILTNSNVPHQVQFSFADFEAEDPDFLHRVALSKSDFNICVSKSMQATANYAESVFRSDGCDTSVGVHRMSEQFDLTSIVDLKDVKIREKAVKSVLINRAGFYDKFFKPQLAGGRREEFRTSRAQHDVAAHAFVGDKVAKMRKDGLFVSLVTQSSNLLANLFNKGRTEGYIPVIRTRTSLGVG